MATIVFIILQIFFATRAENWGIFSDIPQFKMGNILSRDAFRPIARKQKDLMEYNNLLLTELDGRTGEYWPEVVTVRTERSDVRTKRPRANIPQYG